MEANPLTATQKRQLWIDSLCVLWQENGQASVEQLSQKVSKVRMDDSVKTTDGPALPKKTGGSDKKKQPDPDKPTRPTMRKKSMKKKASLRCLCRFLVGQR